MLVLALSFSPRSLLHRVDPYADHILLDLAKDIGIVIALGLILYLMFTYLLASYQEEAFVLDMAKKLYIVRSSDKLMSSKGNDFLYKFNQLFHSDAVQAEEEADPAALHYNLLK